jgi:imidazolonepropionase-like amidohydrolase
LLLDPVITRPMRFDKIWFDARLVTLAAGRAGLGIIERGVIAAKNGRIAFAGPAAGPSDELGCEASYRA